MATEQQIQNVKLGACNVTLSGHDLGLTKGGVSLSITTQAKAVNLDQFGQATVNDYIMGRTGTVKVPMAETDLSKIVLAIAGAVIVIDAVDQNKLYLQIPSAVGLSLVQVAGVLVLHPTSLPVDDVSEDVTIPIAAPTGNITFSFQAENERVYEVEFTMYPDPELGVLLFIGDETADATVVVPPPPPGANGIADFTDPNESGLAAVLFNPL